ncbi:CRC domain-containing protein [Nymphaea thermarum]|nr:CRC domain-containing protein [Nymphaea thermarum]
MEGSPQKKDLIVGLRPLHHRDGEGASAANVAVESSPSLRSPIVQDSPVFNYLSNLSPIKPIKSAHVVQAFGEFNLPPPATIFTSPRDVLKRETIFRRYDSLQFDTGSPSACIGDFLAHSVDDGSKSDDSPDTCCKQATEQSKIQQSSCVCASLSNDDDVVNIKKVRRLRETMLKVSDDVTYIHSDSAGEQVLVQVATAEDTGSKEIGGLEEENENVVDEKWTDVLVQDSDALFDPNLSLQSHTSESQQSENQDHEGANAFSCGASDGKENAVALDKPQSFSLTNACHNHNADGEQPNGLDCTPQLVPQSLMSVENDNPNGKLGILENGPTMDWVAFMGKNQCGISRRCLDFEAAEACTQNMKSGFTSCPSLSADADAVEDVQATGLVSCAALLGGDKCKTFTPNELVSASHHTSSKLSSSMYGQSLSGIIDTSTQKNGNSTMACPKPSGIGLHLNSIGSTAVKHSPCQIPCRNGHTHIQENDISSVVSRHPSDGLKCHFQDSDLVEKSNYGSPVSLSITSGADMNQEEPEFGSADPTFNSLSLNMGMNSEAFGGDLTPVERETTALDDACIYQEDIDQLSSKKKRHIFSLNDFYFILYCDCFAAGVYCIDSCTCKECLNKPECKDMVISARQQIESRNPIAFAPRVVHWVVETTGNGSGGEVKETPPSARHKRGCNCKRSRCLKKYCECYQAGVGCSDSCRCEGCKNMYGQKEGCLQLDYKAAEDVRWKDQAEDDLAAVKTDKNVLHAERRHPNNPSPVTPLLQCSSHERTVSELQHSARKPLSPESELSNHHSDSHRPSATPGSTSTERCMFSEEAHGDADTAGCKRRSRGLKSNKVDEVSPGWEQLAELCSLTPLSCPQSTVTVIGSTDRHPNPGTESQYKSALISSRSAGWQDSPITPVHQMGNKKVVLELDPDAGMHGLMDVETPDILNKTRSPIMVAKAGSPNQKRVSSPRICLSDLARSTTSPGIRSSRKFILQSVPSFPSLTPYCKSKGNEK